ncbi:calcium-translocating P-type ATPase, PMCA-type [Caviibacter abscessus]|uniref:calcium-translocating P-type ATPase, PMCA-type n=1 Tax=Caviibacter abscessus TaxID=1766719 RepID=UPI0008381524|nr:calcium-translocating P-type ATPase, PMCA-type [Caviibacter abscessus]
MKFYQETIEQVLSELKTDIKQGLTNEQAKERLLENGENKLEEGKTKSVLALLFEQLKDVLVCVLLASAALTVIVKHEYIDAIIILAVVVINAVVGVVQELKAEKALNALKNMTSPKAVVIRNGVSLEIDSKDVVVGDIVALDAGRYVPADLRLIESVNLQIEESSFTGESVPAQKNANDVLTKDVSIADMTNMAFMSTLVTYGRGIGIVVATGNNTKIGDIAKLLNEEEDKTPLQKKMNKLGQTLGYGAIVICFFIFIIGVLQGREMIEMFVTAISLAVAAIPEGLVAIIAIVLAMGVTRMSKKNAIIKKLPAVETLGSVNFICSDKTGTLTQNKMTVVKSYFKADSEYDLIKSLILCSDADIVDDMPIGDPTEVAFISYGIKNEMYKKQLNDKFLRIGEVPFDSDRKLMSTLNKENDGYRVHTKGAIDNLLKICPHILVGSEILELSQDQKDEILNIANSMSDEALRVIGVAYKDTNDNISQDEYEKDLVLIGMVGMIDPPRLEVKDSIKKAHQAGINVVMITGDHKNTAFAIAKELNITKDINACMTGTELEKMTDEKLKEVVSKYRVFARVSPEHKVRIVKALKSNGNIVSMTGDGVNDAPSLKIADIGVAMGITGTDVAKGASDMILTDDNFTTIVTAIEEGRNIYNNIKKSIMFLLSCNIGEVISILFATLLGLPIPLLASQILWVNLVTDTFPALALGVDKSKIDVMNKPPRNANESFFAQGAWFRAIVGGMLIGILTLLAFVIGLFEQGVPLNNLISAGKHQLAYARTMSFIVLTISQLFYAYTMRDDKESIFKVGIFSNKYLNYSLIIGVVLQFSLISIPFLAKAFNLMSLTFMDLDIVIGFTLIPLIVNELIKKYIKFGEK